MSRPRPLLALSPWRARLVISALALGLATGALGCRKSADEGPPVLGGTVVRELDDQQRMLRADFDDASARPRLLLLASPT